MSLAAILVALTAVGQFGERSANPNQAPEGYRWNAVSIRAAHAFHNLDERPSVDAGAPADEHLGGFVLGYQRSLVPGLLGVAISNAYLFNGERFDIPIDLSLLVLQQLQKWRLYLALGPTLSLRWYHGDRAGLEGVDFEVTVGVAGGLGVLWDFDRSWSAVVQVHGSLIPSSEVVEAEVTTSAGLAYRF